MFGPFIQLCSLVSSDMASLVRQKTCFLMAAAASLQIARLSSPSDKVEIKEPGGSSKLRIGLICIW